MTVPNDFNCSLTFALPKRYIFGLFMGLMQQVKYHTLCRLSSVKWSYFDDTKARGGGGQNLSITLTLSIPCWL